VKAEQTDDEDRLAMLDERPRKPLDRTYAGGVNRVWMVEFSV